MPHVWALMSIHYYALRPASLYKEFIYFFLREGEKHQGIVASRAPPTGGLAHDPGMCPDWELNWRPFGLQSGAQFTD